MRNSLIISIGLLFLIASCGKPKAGGNPVLKLDKVNTQHLQVNSLLRFTFSFTSGTPLDSIFIDKIVPNCSGTTFYGDSFKVPDFPSSVTEGTIEVIFSNGQIDGYTDLRSPSCGEDDLATFRFVVRDIEGNFSDTIVSPEITILMD